MPRGGRRNGAGRPQGTKMQAFLQSREALWTYIQAQCALGHKANPYEVMVDTMVTTQDPRLQLACAKELAAYLLPRLAAVQLSGDPDHPVTVYQVELT